MAAITAAMVKELRERTGLGMMDCKKALSAADGNMEQAIDDLRKSSAVKAAKKAGRTAAEGLLGVKVSADGRKAVLVEVNIETDFATKNVDFIAFVDRIRDAVFDTGQTDIAALMAGTLDAERETLVQGIGENVTVRRAALLEAPDGVIGHYIHSDNRKACLVALTGGNLDLGRDLAMHVVAASPSVVAPDDVPEDVRAKEREIFTAQAAESGKPAEIVEKMVAGRVRKFLAEVSLVEQPFVKDPNTKVGDLLTTANASCDGFVRFEVGEGIERDETDFAAEVAAQVRGGN